MAGCQTPTPNCLSYERGSQAFISPDRQLLTWGLRNGDRRRQDGKERKRQALYSVFAGSPGLGWYIGLS